MCKFCSCPFNDGDTLMCISGAFKGEITTMLYCKHDGYISSNLWLDTNVQASTQWKDFKLVKTTKKVVKNIPLSLPAFCRIVAKLTSDRGFDLLKNCTVKCDYIFIKDLVIDRMVDDYRNRLNGDWHGSAKYSGFVGDHLELVLEDHKIEKNKKDLWAYFWYTSCTGNTELIIEHKLDGSFSGSFKRCSTYHSWSTNSIWHPIIWDENDTSPEVEINYIIKNS